MMVCRQVAQALESGLPTDLSTDLVRHSEACPDCARELATHRAVDRLLGSVGRPVMAPGFFERQRARIHERVLAEAERVGELAWSAPSGSLVVLAAIVAGYLFVGMEGFFEAFLTVPGLSSHGADPLDALVLVYAGVLALGVYAVVGRSGAGVPEPVAGRAS